MSMNDWHEEYLKRYAESKAKGKSFFPHAVFKDTVMACLILAALAYLAHSRGAGLEDLADPTDTTYNPRPEWYFLFLFQALKFFPGKLEPIGAVVLPGVGVGLLLLIPLLDRGPKRNPLNRPFWTGLGVLGLCGYGWLTWAGYHSPIVNPTEEKDPMVHQGRKLYAELKCAYCHRIGGKGGSVGPELDKVAGGETAEWLARHVRDPQAATPGTVMPKMNLLDDEIAGLVAYMKSFGADESFTPEAPKLFSENCAACHKLGKEGSEVGPDLSLIGSARNKAFIKKYIADPAKVNASATMPSFKESLTETKLEDLARFLAHQGK